MFTLIVENVGIEYVGKRHVDHLINDIKEHYGMIVNEKGDLYAGTNLKWDYDKRTCHLTMEDYIAYLSANFDHPNPKKPQHSPRCHTPINYVAKVQYATETPVSPPLNKYCKLRIQQLIGSIRYYARDVENKLLVGLRELSQQQSFPTEATDTDMLQLINYITTYPYDRITYRASSMVLSGHADVAYLIVSKAHSRAGAHIMLSEDMPVLPHNRPVLTIAQIIKNVMSSSSESELAGLFTISK